MLVESIKIRTLLNQTVASAVDQPCLPSSSSHYPNAHHTHIRSRSEDRETDAALLEEPDTYAFSTNPIPALVILLLGIMMSSHTQESMVSSMVHKQWGTLLTGASFARGLTYVVMWLRPPRSVYPSRPPTELLTAFGLMAGGIVFMASVSFVLVFFGPPSFSLVSMGAGKCEKHGGLLTEISQNSPVIRSAA